MDLVRLLTPEQLASTPAGIPPPGVVSNFVNPPTIGYYIIGALAPLMTIMWVLAALRFYTATFVRKKFLADDWTAALSVIGSIYYYIVLILGVSKVRFGTHMYDVTLAQVASGQVATIAYMINAPINLLWPCIKTTFFLTYLRLFSTLRWLRYCCFIGITISWLYYISQFCLMTYFSAPPPGQTFKENNGSARYLKSFKFGIPTASIALMLDIVIFVLPLIAVSSMRLTFWKKMGVIAMFSTGFLACLASSGSLFIQYYIRMRTDDYLYYVIFLYFCHLIEISVGISVSCMPSLTHLYRAKGPKIKSIITSIGPLRKSKPELSEEQISFRGPMVSKNKYPHLEVTSSKTSLIGLETGIAKPAATAHRSESTRSNLVTDEIVS